MAVRVPLFAQVCTNWELDTEGDRVQSVSVVARKAGLGHMVEPGATWLSAHLPWVILSHLVPDWVLNYCRPIPWSSLCELSTYWENLCAGGWVAAQEKSGLACVVTFLLLSPVKERTPFLLAVEALLTTPGKPTCQFYGPRQELGVFLFHYTGVLFTFSLDLAFHRNISSIRYSPCVTRR